MRQFTITGMSCAACQARVEKAVSSVPGVETCAVSLLTGSMGVEGNAADDAIVKAVTDAGYGAFPRPEGLQITDGNDPLEDRETPVLKKRLLISLLILLPLMYISMGHSMWNWPLPAFMTGNPLMTGLAELILSAAILFINRKFFISGFRGLLHGAPNMDTLVALGSSASFLRSVWVLIEGKTEDLYFDSAAMILVLITVGKLLEARSKGKTTDALKSLMRLAPETATVVRDGTEKVIPAGEIRKEDIFIVRPGESIPADGTILEGNTAVNESALTGESMPVDKAPGERISAATVNLTGLIRCQANRVGEDTSLAQIIRLVSETAATKAPIAKTADRVAGIFVPVVTGIAVLTLLIWLLIGKGFDYALTRAVSVLVISCPCALGLATPVAIMVGNGVGARHGTLFKTAEAMENTGKTRIVVLDKTGTVTRGEPEVTGIYPANGITAEELLQAACSLENYSEHPLARAVIREGEKQNIALSAVSSMKAVPGNGLTGFMDGVECFAGSLKFLKSRMPVDEKVVLKAEKLADQGMTPLLFSRGQECLGIIAVADTVKEESPQAVDELKKMGIRVVLLTGDGTRTAGNVAKQTGIDHVIAGVLPNEKELVVRKLTEAGRTAMVGDGINDAPALTTADVGIAVGAGTDVAIDAADVVLMNSRLTDVPAAIRLSRATLANIRENLFWAFFYNALCIPLAAGCYAGILGWELSPMIGAAAMSISSFCVVSNALRLNLFKPESDKPVRGRSKPVDEETLNTLLEEIQKTLEEKNMTKTMKIEGMMCVHCEARVKKTLEAIEGVASAEVSHTAGTAVVTLTKDVADSVLKTAVEAQDYTVTGIE